MCLQVSCYDQVPVLTNKVVRMKRTTLQRGDARLSIRDYGGGGITLVLIHGLGGSQKSWANLIAALGDDYRIITYDQRGHGASTRSWTIRGHRSSEIYGRSCTSSLWPISHWWATPSEPEWPWRWPARQVDVRR